MFVNLKLNTDAILIHFFGLAWCQEGPLQKMVWLFGGTEVINSQRVPNYGLNCNSNKSYKAANINHPPIVLQ